MRFWKSEPREEPQVEPPAPAPEEPVAAPEEPVAAPEEPVAVAPAAEASPANGDQMAAPSELEEQVVKALRTIFDPEIPVNIYELGLIYDLVVDEAGKANIKMTLTSPNCPVAESLPVDVKNKAASVPGVTAAEVDIVWDPSWSPDMMSEAAKLELGFF